jgi:methanol--5-hydroxybenzimidazolylcobamide Co-methyltransferase
LKVLCGCPVSMEGKSAACAHWSPVGNIASMAADLWSNESVQNVRLLSGSAPEAFLEILAYDCRLLNQATRRGQAEYLRDLLVGSDETRSPQALVLGPQATFEISQAIAEHSNDDYARTVAAGRKAVDIIRRALGRKKDDPDRLRLSDSEVRWLDRIERELDGLPDEPGALAAEIVETYGTLFDPRSYDLGTD